MEATLKMPSSYVLMEAEEMEYTNGGAAWSGQRLYGNFCTLRSYWCQLGISWSFLSGVTGISLTAAIAKFQYQSARLGMIVGGIWGCLAALVVGAAITYLGMYDLPSI